MTGLAANACANNLFPQEGKKSNRIDSMIAIAIVCLVVVFFALCIARANTTYLPYLTVSLSGDAIYF